MSPVDETKSLRERKEEKTRQTILDTAEQLFNSQGISQVSVQDIADKAMLSRATLYNYYGSKDGIMYALVVQRLETGNQRLIQLQTSSIAPYEKLQRFIEISFDASLQSPSRYAILRRFLKVDNARDVVLEEQYKQNYDPKTNSFTNLGDIDLETRYQLKFLEQIWQFEQTLASIIKQGQEQGVIVETLRPMELGHFFIMVINGLSDQLSLHVTPLQKHDISTDTIRNLFLSMVKKIAHK